LAAVEHTERFYWQLSQTPYGQQHSLITRLPLRLTPRSGEGLVARVRQLFPRYERFVWDSSLLDIDAFYSTRSETPTTAPTHQGMLYDGEAMVMAIDLIYLDAKNKVKDLTMSRDIILHSPVQHTYLARLQERSRLVYARGDGRFVSLKFEKYSQEPVTTRNPEVSRYLRPLVREGFSSPQTAFLILRPATGDMSVIRDFFQNPRFPKQAVRAVLDWGPPNWTIDLKPFFEMPNLSHVASFNRLNPKFEGPNLRHSLLYSQGLSRLKSKMF